MRILRNTGTSHPFGRWVSRGQGGARPEYWRPDQKQVPDASGGLDDKQRSITNGIASYSRERSK